MRYNFTPLNIAKYVNGAQESPKDTDLVAQKQTSSGFDKVFFPFSLAILVMSLTFYGVKYMVDSAAATPSQSSYDKVDVSAPVVKEPTRAVQKLKTDNLYTSIGSFKIASSLSDQAKDLYPDLSQAQFVEKVNTQLIEWATLRTYFKSDESVMKDQSLDITKPIDSLNSLTEDLNRLKTAYDKKDSLGKPSLSQLIDEYKSKVKIE